MKHVKQIIVLSILYIAGSGITRQLKWEKNGRPGENPRVRGEEGGRGGVGGGGGATVHAQMGHILRAEVSNPGCMNMHRGNDPTPKTLDMYLLYIAYLGKHLRDISVFLYRCHDKESRHFGAQDYHRRDVVLLTKTPRYSDT